MDASSSNDKAAAAIVEAAAKVVSVPLRGSPNPDGSVQRKVRKKIEVTKEWAVDRHGLCV
eukprot:1184500-Prorocentrum_minimum.AAC.1